MTEDFVTRQESRADRLTRRARAYLERLETTIPRSLDSQPVNREGERNLLEQALYDKKAVGQLFQEIRGRAFSDQDAMEKLLDWARKLNGPPQ